MSRPTYFYAPCNTDFSDLSEASRELEFIPDMYDVGLAPGRMFTTYENSKLGIGCGIIDFDPDEWNANGQMVIIPLAMEARWPHPEGYLGHDLDAYGLPDGSVCHFWTKFNFLCSVVTNVYLFPVVINTTSTGVTISISWLNDGVIDVIDASTTLLSNPLTNQNKDLDGTYLVNRDAWHHIAVTFVDGSVYFFINGVLIYTGEHTSVACPMQCMLYTWDNTYIAKKAIQIDEIVISDSPLWTSNFTPPNVEAYIPVDSQVGITKLLLHMD